MQSVSMSNWSKEEVDALKEENGGGNAVAKRVWLGRWDESQMRKPTEKDHVDYFKKFINKVYNDRAFYDEDALNNPSATQRAPAAKPTMSRQGNASASSNGHGTPSIVKKLKMLVTLILTLSFCAFFFCSQLVRLFGASTVVATSCCFV
jgi:hypothetical protein